MVLLCLFWVAQRKVPPCRKLDSREAKPGSRKNREGTRGRKPVGHGASASIPVKGYWGGNKGLRGTFGAALQEPENSSRGKAPNWIKQRTSGGKRGAQEEGPQKTKKKTANKTAGETCEGLKINRDAIQKKTEEGGPGHPK